MTVTGRRRILLLVLFCSVAAANERMTVGDGRIDGTKLAPYRLDWQQCSLQDGRWQDAGKLTEELVVVGDDVLRQHQEVRRPDGVLNRTDTWFERSSLAPLRMDQRASRGDVTLLHAERRFDTEGYSGTATRGEETRELAGVISSQMLHGGALGLPLATMAWQETPVEFAASMVGFDATYTAIAEWVGTEMLDVGDLKVEAWLIDVEWHHRESGDVYPPGPDASGGRYWVAPNPPEGFPYVPRYQTDTYVVEFVASVCSPKDDR